MNVLSVNFVGLHQPFLYPPPLELITVCFLFFLLIQWCFKQCTRTFPLYVSCQLGGGKRLAEPGRVPHDYGEIVGTVTAVLYTIVCTMIDLEPNITV